MHTLQCLTVISIDEFNAGVSKEIADVRRHRLEAVATLFDQIVSA